MEFDGRDALRFLGVRGEPDAALRARLADAAARVRAAAAPAWTAKLLPLRADGDALDFGGGALAVRSAHLARNLRGCDRAFLFASTLGAGVDRLVRGREAVGEMADAALLQAVAGELADSLCEDVVAELARDPAVAGCALRHRFSPGYGDLPLSVQPAFLAALDATRRIGITLTGANLMVPTKSVTAFVGVEPPPGKYAGPQHESESKGRSGEASPESQSVAIRAVAGHTCPAPGQATPGNQPVAIRAVAGHTCPAIPRMHQRCLDWDYRSRCIYLVTFVTRNRRPVLGELGIPVSQDGTRLPEFARVEPSETGRIVEDCWSQIPARWPGVSILEHQLMPDHFHGVIFVREPQEKPLGQILRGFAAGCTSRAGFPVWQPGFHDSILFRDGQLANMRRYVLENPRRLALRRLHPDLFRAIRDLRVGETDCAALGNPFLVERPELLQVQCSRRIAPEELAARKAEWLAAARHGAVLVSPCISPGEKEVSRAALTEGLPLVVLLENGFAPGWKPPGAWFKACAEGRLLLLAPWPHHADKRPITRAQCLALNALAERICGGEAPANPPGKYAGPQHESESKGRSGEASPKSQSAAVRAVAGHTCPAPGEASPDKQSVVIRAVAGHTCPAPGEASPDKQSVVIRAVAGHTCPAKENCP